MNDLNDLKAPDDWRTGKKTFQEYITWAYREGLKAGSELRRLLLWVFFATGVVVGFIFALLIAWVRP